jgi:hypothetical protein
VNESVFDPRPHAALLADFSDVGIDPAGRRNRYHELDREEQFPARQTSLPIDGTDAMKEIEVVHGERLPRLFSQLGKPLRSIGLRCESLAEACNLLHDEHFDYALLEAANEFHAWRLDCDHRRAADEEGQLRLDAQECLRQVTGTAGRLLEAGFDDKARDKVLRTTKTIMILAMIERRWNMPVDDRIFGPLDAVIAQGHIVCGWVDGLYPEGQWAVW